MTIGIIGTGKLGIVLAQLAVKANYRVLMAGSDNNRHLALTLSSLVPEASATPRASLIEASDIIILAIPLSKYRTIKPDELTDKLVIDAMNYWWEVDGDKESLLYSSKNSSEQVQSYFKGASIIKALSHVGYHDLYDHADQAGQLNRRAIAIAGDSPDNVAIVAKLIDTLGFDPVKVGDLAAGKILEPGSALFGASLTKKELQHVLNIKSTTQ